MLCNRRDLKQWLLLTVDPVPLFFEKVFFFLTLLGLQAFQLSGFTLADEAEDQGGQDTGDGKDYRLYEHLAESQNPAALHEAESARLFR